MIFKSLKSDILLIHRYSCSTDVIEKGMSIKSVTYKATRIKQRVINPLETTNDAVFSEEYTPEKVLIHLARWQAPK